MPVLTFELSAPVDADQVFSYCRDVSIWPIIMPAVKSARVISRDEKSDQVEITAEANEEEWTWRSDRTIDLAHRKIDFFRRTLPKGVSKMQGSWSIGVQSVNTVISLRHEFSVQSGEADLENFLRRSIKRNSVRDLAALVIHAVEQG